MELRPASSLKAAILSLKQGVTDAQKLIASLKDYLTRLLGDVKAKI